MEELKSSPIFNFNPGQMDAVRQTFGYKDVDKLKQDIDIFEDWIQKQNHFVIREFDRRYLERYIIYNKGSVERAKKRFDRLCTLRNLMPEFLRNFDLKNEFIHLSNCVYFCALPNPTPDNYRVVVIRIFGNDVNVDFTLIYRYMFLLTEYVLNNDYCVGYEIIVDTRDIDFGMMAKMNPIIIHKGTTLLSEGMGQRIKKIHFMNGSKFFDKILHIVKQGLSNKLSKRVEIHSTYDTLYQFVPRKILPKDYGGDEKSIQELAELNFKVLTSDAHAERMRFMEQAATDESFRLTSKFNEEYSGMPGSFKTLCVD